MSPAGETPAASSRRVWHVVEPLHAVIYFAPDVRHALADVGLRGFWMGYFAGRAAPLGAVPADVVAAVAFNFHPDMVARAIPDAWRFCPPEQVLDVRRRATGAALESLIGAGDNNLVDEAVELAEAAVARLDVAGRVLAAANRSVSGAATRWERLWQACTTLREHLGDGHVASLVAESLNGVTAHVLHAAVGGVPRDVLQPNRGWSDGEWAEAGDVLRRRQWIDEAGSLTVIGRAAKARIEARTDELANVVWTDHTAARDRFLELVGRLAAAVHRAGVIPYPNAMGLDRDAAPSPASS